MCNIIEKLKDGLLTPDIEDHSLSDYEKYKLEKEKAETLHGYIETLRNLDFIPNSLDTSYLNRGYST